MQKIGCQSNLHGKMKLILCRLLNPNSLSVCLLLPLFLPLPHQSSGDIFTAHSILHNKHWTQHMAYFTLNTANYILHAKYYTNHTKCYTLHTLKWNPNHHYTYYTLITVQCTIHIARCIPNCI